MINSFYDLIYILIKGRRAIVILTACFGLTALVLSLVIPKKYKATATLMPPVSQGSNIMTLMIGRSMISDPEIGGTGYMPGMVTPSDVFAYMLESGTVSGIIIKECNLIQHYKLTKTFLKKPDKAMFDVSKHLGKATKIKVTEERFITITVEDKDKNKAAEIANMYSDALDRIYAGMTMTQGRKMREFIEKRVEQELALLRDMEDSLKIFQQRYRTMSITDEMKAVIEMAAGLEAKIMNYQIELEVIRAYSSDDNMQVKVLGNQVKKTKEELDNLINGTHGRTLFVPIVKAPAVGQQLGRLMRDVKIHQELYSLLVQQLEQAKIMEAKDTPKVQVLERATPPYKKSWPKRSLITLIGFFTGFIVSLLYIFVNAWWVDCLNDPIIKGHYETITALLRG